MDQDISGIREPEDEHGRFVRDDLLFGRRLIPLLYNGGEVDVPPGACPVGNVIRPVARLADWQRVSTFENLLGNSKRSLNGLGLTSFEDG